MASFVPVNELCRSKLGEIRPLKLLDLLDRKGLEALI